MCVWLKNKEVEEFTVYLKDGLIVREETNGKDPMKFDPGIPFERLTENAVKDGGWQIPAQANTSGAVVFKRK